MEIKNLVTLIFCMIISLFFFGCGHSIIVVDKNGCPIREAKISHMRSDPHIWYVSNNKTNSKGHAYVIPQFFIGDYKSVKVEYPGYEDVILTKKSYLEYSPRVIVLENLPTNKSK